MSAPVVPSQERSRRRREALLRSAVELMTEGGERAVTHRAVAARAGVPAATTTYYFATVHDLVEDALRWFVDQQAGDMRQLLADMRTSPSSDVEAAVRRLAGALTGRSRTTIVATIEIHLYAARNPALRGTVADAIRVFEDLAASALAALGVRRARDAAGALVAMVDGFALRAISQPDDSRRQADALFEALRCLVIAYTMRPGDLDAWADSLDRSVGLPPPAGPLPPEGLLAPGSPPATSPTP
ncbi:MAG: TetR family transcriptional regulator [Actinomycetota bacterium]|nr:TetR family transcriptional regulator [Actinomycetota bacterium]